MAEWSKYLADEADTVTTGEQLGAALSHAGAFTVHLEGDLGAGKTTFTRGILRSFGHSGAVKSPTYTLVEEYALANRLIYHFDLYRLGEAEELEYMGIRDYFAGNNLCLIEWPIRGRGVLPDADLLARLEVQAPGRIVKLIAHSERGVQVIRRLTFG